MPVSYTHLELYLDKGILLFKGSCTGNSPLSLPDGFCCVLESDNHRAAALLQNSHFPVVTCGMGAKDTLSVASLDDGNAVLSLQRSVAALDGRILEPHDFRVSICTGTGPRQILAVSMTLLLSGIESVSYTHLIYHLPFTYLELAETLNIGRASLYRAMDSLQQYGVLQRNGRDLSILDPDVLRRIVSSAEQYAEQCLAAFLLSVCPEETPHVYHLPFTYLELSKNLNIGRASLYRAMNSLQRCGVLQRDGHDLFILDPDALRRMVSHTELDSVRHCLLYTSKKQMRVVK